MTPQGSQPPPVECPEGLGNVNGLVGHDGARTPARSSSAATWQTKPSDRFVLRWIKIHLAARITPCLLTHDLLRPWMVTLCAAFLGVSAGVALAVGWAFLAGTLAACAQVLDGVDGQLARLKGVQSRGGAFWDSVLDRYADGALVIGLILYLLRPPALLPSAVILTAGSLALIGSNLVSYTSARAEALGIDLGKPTLANKGTRTAVIICCAWAGVLWPQAPLAALLYLCLHPNGVVIRRLTRTLRDGRPLG
jgi:phosphatidylglycerophosphate synthase